MPNINLKPMVYYKWHWQDWRANRRVQQMSYVERGLYRDLLDECWAEGFIPNSTEAMADICGCPLDVMAQAWQVLSKCFVEVDGVFINARLNKERTEKDKERADKAISGRKGGMSKLLKEKESEANAKHLLSTCHIEEKRREEKRIKTLPSPSGDKGIISAEKITELYNAILHELASVKLLTDKRRSSIRSCCAMKPTYDSEEFWEAYFTDVRKSDFLMGRRSDWKADFDFLTTKSKFVKVIEGSYQ